MRKSAPRARASFRAFCFPMGRFPFSISEIWRCGMPEASERAVCVNERFFLCPASTSPGTTSLPPGNASLQGIRSSASSSSSKRNGMPDFSNALIASFFLEKGHVKRTFAECRASVGGVFVSSNVYHLHKNFIALFFPYGNIRRASFFQMAMMTVGR